MQWLREDDEAKYYLGVAAGAGVAFLGEIISTVSVAPPATTQATSKANTGQTAQFEMPPLTLPPIGMPDLTGAAQSIPSWMFLFGPGMMASNVGIASWLINANTGNTTAGVSGILPKDPIEMVSGVMTLAGTGFAGFCAAVLILKAIFGEGGMAEVLKGIGEIVPG